MKSFWGVCMKRLTMFLLLGILVPSFAYGNVSLGSIVKDSDYDQVFAVDEYQLSADPSATVFTFELILENAGFANTNLMGIYSVTDPLDMLKVFQGSDGAGLSVNVQYDSETGSAWTDPAEKVIIGDTFGFYLDSSARSKGGLFYSDPTLNTGSDNGVKHSLMFDTKGIGSSLGGFDFVLAFEDLRADVSSYDGDYNDMVFGVTASGVTSVPEPATIALLGFVASAVSIKRKK